MRQNRREYYDIPEAFSDSLSKIYNLKTRSDNFPTASRRRAIRTRLKPLKNDFFFVVGFDIPRIIKTFRLEKSQF